MYKTRCLNGAALCVNTELGLDGNCVRVEDVGRVTLTCIPDTTVLKQYTGMQAEL